MKKIWGGSSSVPCIVEAQLAYTGPLFSKTKAFAEKYFYMRWYILSDKYGLITPNTLISDYNTSPHEIQGDPNFLNLVKSQITDFKLTPSVIYTTCGKIHEDILTEVFPHSLIKNPVCGLSQGKRLQKLNKIMGESNVR
jgi:hypothetical protein